MASWQLSARQRSFHFSIKQIMQHKLTELFSKTSNLLSSITHKTALYMTCTDRESSKTLIEKQCSKIDFIKYGINQRKNSMNFLLSESRELESSVSEILASDDGVVGVVVSGGSDIHAVVGLDVAASGVVTGDTSLGLLSERPARVVSADAVDSVDEDAGGLLHVLLGVPGTLDVVVSSVNLHQAPAVALATIAVSPSVLPVPGLEGRASSGLSGDDGTDKVVVDVLLGTGAASLGLVLSELGPIVGSKSLRAGFATSVAVAVLNRN